MRISLIAAAARSGVIGAGGHLPWHLPDDLKRFKQLTLGHHVIMGRRTFESIGKALPGRTSVVITRAPARTDADPSVVLAESLDAALATARAAGESEVFVIGGGEIFALALPAADRFYLTRIDADVPGDTLLPPLDPAEWNEVAREEHPSDPKHEFAFALTVLERRPARA